MSLVGRPTVKDYDPGSGHCGKVVLKLMESYLDKEQDLYMENFYNSASLSLKLQQSRTRTVDSPGAIRKHKPVEVTKSKLKVGEACWRKKVSVYVSKWKDKKEVLMIRTEENHNMMNTTNRRKQVKVKPQAVNECNVNQGVGSWSLRPAYFILQQSKKDYRVV